MAENDASQQGMNFNETEWEFLAAIGALEYLNFDTSMESVRDDAAEIATIIVRHAQSADLAAPDAAQGNENTTRFLEHFITRVEPFYEKKHGKLPPQEGALWELLMFVQHELDAVRQARRETWNLLIAKLHESAEDWRLQAERWQKQAENEANEEIRNLSFSDRDACLSKMAALKTFAIEAAALRAEGEKGE